MHHEWMIDVLGDLRQFATKHDLNRLADQLDDTILVAATELVVETPRGGLNVRTARSRLGQRCKPSDLT